IGRDAGRRPALAGCVAKLDQHPRHRVGSAVENADAKIDKFEVFDKALIFAEILAQCEIERIDWPLAFGRRDQGFVSDTHLDDRLRHGDEIALRIVAALDIDAKAFDLEIFRHLPENSAGQKLERGIRALVGVAKRFLLLYLIEKTRDPGIILVETHP